MPEAELAKILKRGRTVMLCVPELDEDDVSAAFETAELQEDDATCRRGIARRVRLGVRSGMLKHYFRGGWAALLSRDRYLWTGLERTRAFWEWRLLARLHGSGLPVPEPLAARVTVGRGYYRADLVTAEIENSESLGTILETRGLPPETWRRIGTIIRRVHQARIDHADLNADNVLINTEGKVFLIDFDRGHVRTGAGRWQEKNLARLQRSLEKWSRRGRFKHWKREHFEALLSGYRSAP